MTDRAITSDDHAAGMDRMYRYTRHVYDLTRKYYLLGRDRLVRDLDLPEGGTVLEIGCGTGRNLIAVARRWPKARVHGVDISEEMLKTARAAIAAAGLADRVTVARADAVTLDPAPLFGRATFDRVCFSYTLSMIPDWTGALGRALDLVAPTGRFHAVDFGRFERLPGLVKRLMRWWLTQFHVTPRETLDTALEEAAAARGRSVVIERPYLGYAQSAVVR